MAAELIFNCLVGLGIVFFLVQALFLPQTDNPSDMLGAGGFPVILGVLGLIVLAAVTVRVIREKKSIKLPMFDMGSLDGRSLALNVVVLFVYMMVLDVVGFVLTTLHYLLAAGWSLGYRKAPRLAIYAAAVTAALTVVFGILFAVPLPRGAGPLRELSYLIY